MDNTFTWNGLAYIVKPFNMGNYFALLEVIGKTMESGKYKTDMFTGNCKALLEGTTQTAKNFLASGELAKSVLDSEDYEAANQFVERLDFFQQSYIERAQGLKKSAPDLTELLAQKEEKVLAPSSPKVTKRGRGHSG